MQLQLDWPFGFISSQWPGMVRSDNLTEYRHPTLSGQLILIRNGLIQLL